MSATSTPSATALLVEDEALVAMVAEENLRYLGFQPVCASTGREALAHCLEASDELALAVVDVGLPDMRGDELALELRARRPAMKIIVASGYDPLALRGRFPNDASVAIVSKPYSEDDLRQAIVSLGLATT